MSDWRIHNHYGHGAGNIPIEGRAHRRPVRPDGLIRGLSRALHESGNPLQVWLRIIAFVPLVLFTLFVTASLIVRIATPTADTSSVEMVMMDSLEFAIPPPEEIIPEPIPLPEPESLAHVPIRKPEPPPPPVIEPMPKSEPKPPQRMQAKIEPAPPPPKPKPRERIMPEFTPQKLAVKAPPKPEPTRRSIRPDTQRREAMRPQIQMDKVARNEPVKELQRAERMRRQLPKAAQRPRVDLSPLAAVQETRKVDVAQQTRRPVAAARNQQRQRPDLAPVNQAPVIEESQPPPRSERFAVTVPTPESRRRPDAPVLPMSSPQTYEESNPEPTRRSQAVASSTSRSKSTSAPAFDVALASPEISDDSAGSPTQRVRAAAPRPGQQESRVDVRSLQMANAGRNAASQAHPASMSREESIRVARVQQQGVGDTRAQSPALQGVPLGSLASCRSDREEDSLKLRLVAAAKSQTECTSSAGTYRFIETKNLNAFLMWIQRASDRPVSDRCVELGHALECLAR